MRRPCDVKLTADEVFVLCLNPLHSRYCILVFNQMGFKLRSIILRGLSQQSSESWISINPIPYPAFCLDRNGNFILNDVRTGEVKFFTTEGTLFQNLEKFCVDPNEIFHSITGLALTANHKLFVVYKFLFYFYLHIYSSL